ncbi:methyltransferase domain-containing protein [Vulcaniibacterium tengchongense]|uniref:Methyltransferase type 11 domain-containing protein n=1 Tax=Vulcaniibacterium tengchongense TaxID=1273429 RepID=A0A3N4VE03_9GAMM|nr:methyltransferase domain-containing protein [Vulcaniibacterium tengchongense]RPE81232.1 hypothetical protein EDC50_0414 [Vulcaniibacterium tengchongense]
MPARSPPRQPAPAPPGALAWYASEAGQGVLAVEERAMARVLAGCPALPWLWLGVPGAVAPEATVRRGVRLCRTPGGLFDGTVRCGLPLPLASESMCAVLLQHALDDTAAIGPLLDECARVLAPGGVLWLAALNPWSPYRARWARSGLRARDPGRWQAALRRAGFAVDTVGVQWLGPHWRVAHGEVGIGAADRLRAGIALTVSKRVHAPIPPTPVPALLRWQGAPAGGRGARRAREAIMRR